MDDERDANRQGERQGPEGDKAASKGINPVQHSERGINPVQHSEGREGGGSGRGGERGGAANEKGNG
ncbi:MAG TPA: hypothetical protein VIP46_17050 [Pyrinomonadaceae bacterium]